MQFYKKIINKLIKYKISLSVCESCTGGLLSSKITSFKGVSQIFNCGMITYSNKSKIKLLKLNKNILKKYGAVSKEVAKVMVTNLYKITKSKICISTTGIAGPKGKTKNKPVGLVYIGIKYKNEIIILKKNYKGKRKEIQNNTVKTIFYEINKLI
ncbi:MAG: Nicotinamide-nucleotide amidohydrolase PncC [Alphaproteobacteria bacterium MarineAlpha5_Bin9]|nr:MAG: Nicotinamide-nucleotide amidohydrolase PncC [Alphaproteobacteria bacterium MarineAlpha5_Bin9]|tara:strand:+ start:974 stop:1438 length:465 start_codon:yes stop_codon:yes gene_type:complete